MSDTYQAIYDAVRSKFSGLDVGRAIQEGCHLDASLAIESIKHELCYAIDAVKVESMRPSAIYRPGIGIDGNKWCALYGDNLQNGVAGFGDSPALAMADFDAAWTTNLGDNP